MNPSSPSVPALLSSMLPLSLAGLIHYFCTALHLLDLFVVCLIQPYLYTSVKPTPMDDILRTVKLLINQCNKQQ